MFKLLHVGNLLIYWVWRNQWDGVVSKPALLNREKEERDICVPSGENLKEDKRMEGEIIVSSR